MRTRTRTDVTRYPDVRWERQTGGVTDATGSPTPGVLSPSSGSASITDIGTATGTVVMKPCLHSFTRTSVLGDTPVLYARKKISSSPLIMQDYYTNYGLVYPASLVLQGYLNPGSPLTGPTLASVSANVKARAKAATVPSLNDGLSLTNFLLELKDLRRMFEHPFRELKRFREGSGVNPRHREYRLKGYTLEDFVVFCMKRRNESWPNWLRRLGSRFTDVSAANFLSYSFGWAPFVNDIVGIVRALSEFSKRLEQLRRNQGKVLIRRYRRRLTGYDSTTTTLDRPIDDIYSNDGLINNIGVAKPFPDMRGLITGHSRMVYQPTYVYCRQFVYTLPDLTPTMLRIRGFISALGLRVDPGVIWNAIPFSFVLDWLFDVGAFLQRFDSDALGVDLTILDECESITWHSLREVSVEVTRAGDPLSNSTQWVNVGKQLVAQVESSYYERATLSGISRGQLGGQVPRVRHVLLGSALLWSLSRNRRPRVVGSVSETGPNS